MIQLPPSSTKCKNCGAEAPMKFWTYEDPRCYQCALPLLEWGTVSGRLDEFRHFERILRSFQVMSPIEHGEYFHRQTDLLHEAINAYYVRKKEIYEELGKRGERPKRPLPERPPPDAPRCAACGADAPFGLRYRGEALCHSCAILSEEWWRCYERERGLRKIERIFRGYHELSPEERSEYLEKQLSLIREAIKVYDIEQKRVNAEFKERGTVHESA
jgi:hypothetical protein